MVVGHEDVADVVAHVHVVLDHEDGGLALLARHLVEDTGSHVLLAHGGELEHGEFRDVVGLVDAGVGVEVLLQRDVDEEGRARGLFALHADGAAERIHDGGHEREADAGTLLRSVQGIEALENLLHVLRRNIGAAVEHRQADLPPGGGAGRIEPDPDRTLLVHMVEGVGEEVREHLLHLDRVEGDLVVGPVRLVAELEVSAPYHIREHLEDLAQEFVEVAHRVVDHHLAALEGTEVQQLGDQARELAAVALEDVQGHRGALGHVLVGEQVVDRAADQRQRRLELVGDVGEERELGLRGLLQLLRQVDQLLLLLLQRLHLLADLLVLLVELVDQPVACPHEEDEDNEHGGQHQHEDERDVHHLLLALVAEGIAADAGIQLLGPALLLGHLLHLGLEHADVGTVDEFRVQQVLPLVVDAHQDPAGDVDHDGAARRIDERGVDHAIEDVRDGARAFRREKGINADDLRQMLLLGRRVGVVHAGGHLVVEGEDQVEGILLLGLREEPAHHPAGILTVEIGRLLGGNGHLRGVPFHQRGEEALIPLGIRGRAAGAADEGYPLPASDDAHHIRTGDAADLAVVSPDEGGVLVAVHLAVIEDYRDAGVVRLLHDGSQRFRFVGRDDQQVDTLRDEVLDVLDLLFRVIPDRFDFDGEIVVERRFLHDLGVRHLAPCVHAALGHTDKVRVRPLGAGEQGGKAERKQRRQEQSLHGRRFRVKPGMT